MGERKQRKDIDKAIRHIMTYADKQPNWHHRLTEMFDQWFDSAADYLHIELDVLMEMMHDSGCWYMVFGYVFEEFVTCHWDDKSQSCIEDYLNRRGWRESPIGRQYLTALNSSSVQLWEIVDVKPGYYAEIRPFGTQETTIKVQEKAATESLQRWDCLAARVLNFNGQALFSGALLSVPPESGYAIQQILRRTQQKSRRIFQDLIKEGEIKSLLSDFDEILEEETQSYLPEVVFRVWVAQLFRSMTQPPLQVRNRDGDPFTMVTVRFDLNTTSDEIIHILNSVPELHADEAGVSWGWLSMPANEVQEGQSATLLGQVLLGNHSLDVLVNSKERAQKAIKWLSALLGDRVSMAEAEYAQDDHLFDVNIDHENEVTIDRTESLDSVPLAASIARQHLDQHYLQVLDEPVPMLNLMTTRECADKPEFHHELIVWLKTLENKSNRSRSGESEYYDFGWLWEELGVSDQR